MKVAPLSWSFGDHSSLNSLIFPPPSLCEAKAMCFYSHMFPYADFHLPKRKELKRAIIVSLKILPQLHKLLGAQPKETHSPLAQSI